jgi:hypothetical protein
MDIEVYQQDDGTYRDQNGEEYEEVKGWNEELGEFEVIGLTKIE